MTELSTAEPLQGGRRSKHLIEPDTYEAGVQACRNYILADPFRPRYEAMEGLVSVCLENGVNTKGAIIGILGKLGHWAPKQVAMIIKDQLEQD